jgi:dihydrofolate reductase
VRKIINSTYISVDGVIENPQDWPPSTVPDERSGTIQTDLLLACDAVLMGRRTYEAFAPVWSSRSGDPFSDRINAMEKYIVSSKLRDPDWNNSTVLSGDVVGQIARLKEQPGMNIVQYGFGVVSYALLAAGLIDELRLWVHPFFVGRGGPQDLLYRDTPLTKLELVDTTQLNSGLVILNYRVLPSAA